MPSRRSAFRLFLFSLLLISLGVHAAIPTSGLVGSLKGEFSVDPSGAANYDIPIQLPPNVGGVQPKLSFHYNSNSGNGLMGMGWQLAGLSEITRCPTTLERDGYIDGVDFDSNDQFCLDGQRLVSIGSGQYRTEIDNFSHITGTASAGFTVYAADGTTLYYGTSSSSQILAQGKSHVMVWALERVEDMAGNHYRVEYQNDGYSLGEYYPTAIYMGNGSLDLSGVEFEYEDRLDVISGYVSGSRYQTSQRLLSVHIYVGSNSHKTYLISYVPPSEGKKVSLVGSVSECDSSLACTQKLETGLVSTITQGYFSQNWVATDEWGGAEYTWTGDFNGDGLADIASANGSNIFMKLSTGTGFVRQTWWVPNNWGHHTGTWVADFNGDGLDDIASAKAGVVYVNLSNGGAFNQKEWSVTNQWGIGYTWVGDFDGNGLPDIASANAGNIFMKLSTGSGFISKTWVVPNNWGGAEWTWSGDFNGDGLTDIATAYFGDIYIKYSNGSGFNQELWKGANNWGGSDWTWTGDFNGDGLTDIASAYYGEIRLKISTGQGFKDETWSTPGKWGHHTGTWAIDVDRDGLTDLISVNGSEIYSYISTGNGFKDYTDTVNNEWGIGYTWPADFTGDGRPDIASANHANIYVKIPKQVLPFGLVHSFVAGDVANQVVYKSLVNSSDYSFDSRTTEISSPTSAVVRYQANYTSIAQRPKRASFAVSIVQQPDGVGSTKTSSYKYEGLRYDRYAKRSLGFAKTTITDNKTLITTENLFSQSYPFVGMVLDTQSYRSTVSRLLSKATYTLKSITTDATRKIFFPTVSASTETSHFYNNALTRVGSKFVTTTQTHNATGQVEASTSVITGDGHTYTTTTTNEYTNGYTYRRQGEVTRSTVSTYSDIATELTRASEFDYDWDTGRLLKEVIEPDSTDASIKRVAVHSYDDFGNKTRTITCSGTYEFNCTTTTPGARFSTTTFDANGLFPISASNALGHTATSTFDARFGVVLTATDINGLTTTNQYDSLGRLTRSTSPLGVVTTVTRAWCTTSTCPLVGTVQPYSRVTTATTGAPTSVNYFDQFEREVRKQVQGFDGRLIYVDTEYDSFGRVKRTSEPYFQGATAFWNTPTYDLLSRKTQVSTPNQDGTYDTSSRIEYNGYTTTIIDALGRSTVEEKNALDRVVRMTDKMFGNTLYEYDALGNLLKTIDPAGNEVDLTYDIRGRKIAMSDPDMGNWTYQYNVFDELVEQKDGKDQRTRMNYDVLGRMTSRIDSYGTTSPQTSTWTYSTTAGKTLGKPTQKTAANGDYTSYAYNTTYGQMISSTQKIGTKTFTIKNSYDTLGRVLDVTYPVTTAYPTGLSVRREYNSLGYLSKVRKTDNTQTFWTAVDMNARLQLEAATYGNGTEELTVHSPANGWLSATATSKGTTDLRDMTYYFDRVGRIISRVDAVQSNMEERFDYDNLDRLTGSYVLGGASSATYVSKSYAYDALGNITNKSDVGTYSYTGCGNRPHAVCNAGGTTYVYDANGSMTSATKSGATTTVAYTSFNLANYMAKGNYALTFTYDADRNRNYKSRIQNGSLNLQTYYVGTDAHGNKLFEQEVGGITKDIHYIYAADGQTVAAHIGEGTTKRTEYYHRDHLGSVELVTNDAGTTVSKVSFDPWGQRRNTNWTDNSTGSGLPPITGNIGYTGQESLTEIGLIHMNGRIYDPMLGRFLSADPIIQAPYNSQSYNRYSYVMNNPLSLVDPSGYSWISKKWKKVKEFAQKNWSAVKYAATWYFAGDAAAFWTNKSVRNYIKDHKWAQQTLSVVAGVADAMGCMGACTAGMTTYLAKVQGASWSDALKAGGRAGAAAYIMAVVGGANRGGNAYGGNWLETGAITGAAGGVGSEITGGSFKDGFKMAAGSAMLKSAIEGFTTYEATYDTPDSSDSVLKPNSDMIGDKILCPSCDVVNPNANNIGKANYALSIDQVGKTASPGFWSASEGAGWSRALSKIPGFNSGAVFHDVFVGTTGRLLGTQNWGAIGSAMGELIYNQGTIVPLIGMNYVALGQATLARNNRNALEYY